MKVIMQKKEHRIAWSSAKQECAKQITLDEAIAHATQEQKQKDDELHTYHAEPHLARPAKIEKRSLTCLLGVS